MSKRYKTELIKVLDKLPEEKAIELIDFGKFLLSQYPGTSKSQIDENSILLQQKSLSKIWLPFPFITTGGQQKARPALVVSDHHQSRD